MIASSFFRNLSVYQGLSMQSLFVTILFEIESKVRNLIISYL